MGNFWILRIGLAGILSSLQKSQFLNLNISFLHYFWCQNWNQWYTKWVEKKPIYIFFTFCSKINKFAKSHQIAKISCQICVIAKSLPGNISSESKCIILPQSWTCAIPSLIYLIKLGDVQKTGVLRELRPAFSREFFKKWINVLTVWSRNQDCWYLLFP